MIIITQHNEITFGNTTLSETQTDILITAMLFTFWGVELLTLIIKTIVIWTMFIFHKNSGMRDAKKSSRNSKYKIHNWSGPLKGWRCETV